MSNKTLIEVPFNQIEIPDEENVRSKLVDIDKLAASIKANGLLQPIGVVNGGKGDKPYKVKYGFRRAHAMKLLKWGDKLVPVMIVDQEDAVIKTLVENVERQDVQSIDLAQRLHDLETGDAPGADGKKYSKKELAERLNKSLSHISNLIRSHKNLGKTAKVAWRKHNPPTAIVFSWAALSEEEQESAVARYLKEVERSKEKEDKLAGKSTGGDGESEGGSSRGKKGSEDEGPQPLVKGKKASLLESNMEILQWKIDQGVIKSKEEVAEAKGQIQLIRFMLGDIARFPSVSAADMREYGKWLKAQQAEEESEDEEGDE